MKFRSKINQKSIKIRSKFDQKSTGRGNGWTPVFADRHGTLSMCHVRDACSTFDKNCSKLVQFLYCRISSHFYSKFVQNCSSIDTKFDHIWVQLVQNAIKTCVPEFVQISSPQKCLAWCSLGAPGPLPGHSQSAPGTFQIVPAHPLDVQGAPGGSRERFSIKIWSKFDHNWSKIGSNFDQTLTKVWCKVRSNIEQNLMIMWSQFDRSSIDQHSITIRSYFDGKSIKVRPKINQDCIEDRSKFDNDRNSWSKL